MYYKVGLFFFYFKEQGKIKLFFFGGGGGGRKLGCISALHLISFWSSVFALASTHTMCVRKRLKKMKLSGICCVVSDLSWLLD